MSRTNFSEEHIKVKRDEALSELLLASKLLVKSEFPENSEVILHLERARYALESQATPQIDPARIETVLESKERVIRGILYVSNQTKEFTTSDLADHLDRRVSLLKHDLMNLKCEGVLANRVERGTTKWRFTDSVLPYIQRRFANG